MISRPRPLATLVLALPVAFAASAPALASERTSRSLARELLERFPALEELRGELSSAHVHDIREGLPRSFPLPGMFEGQEDAGTCVAASCTFPLPDLTGATEVCDPEQGCADLDALFSPLEYCGTDQWALTAYPNGASSTAELEIVLPTAPTTTFLNRQVSIVCLDPPTCNQFLVISSDTYKSSELDDEEFRVSFCSRFTADWAVEECHTVELCVDSNFSIESFSRRFIVGRPATDPELVRVAIPRGLGMLATDLFDDPPPLKQIGEHPGQLSSQYMSIHLDDTRSSPTALVGARDLAGRKKTYWLTVEGQAPDQNLVAQIVTYPKGELNSDGRRLHSFLWLVSKTRQAKANPTMSDPWLVDWVGAAEYWYQWAHKSNNPSRPWLEARKIADPENTWFSSLVEEARLFGRERPPACLPSGCMGGETPNEIPDVTTAPAWSDELAELQSYYGVTEVIRLSSRALDHNATITSYWGDWLPTPFEFVTEAMQPGFPPTGVSIGAYFNRGPFITSVPGYSPSDTPVEAIPPGYVGAGPGGKSLPASDALFYDQFGNPALSPSARFSKDQGCSGCNPVDFGETHASLDWASEFVLDQTKHVLGTWITDVGIRGAYFDLDGNAKAVRDFNPLLPAEEVGDAELQYDRHQESIGRLRDYIRSGVDQADAPPSPHPGWEIGQYTAPFSADPEFFFETESITDLMIGSYEVCLNNIPTTTLSDYNAIRIPLRTMLFGEYFVTAHEGPILGLVTAEAATDPLDLNGLDDLEGMTWNRHLFATNLVDGHAPTLTSTMASATISSLALDAAPWFKSTELFQSVLEVHQCDLVRDYMMFGRLRRRPAYVNPRGTLITSPFGEVDPFQPFVLTGAFTLPEFDLPLQPKKGVATNPSNTLGLALINWTDSTDSSSTSLPLLSPSMEPILATETVTLDLLPEDYELDPGTYVAVEVTDCGQAPVPFEESPTVQWSATLATGVPFSITVPVPEKSMRFVLIQKQ